MEKSMLECELEMVTRLVLWRNKNKDFGKINYGIAVSLFIICIIFFKIKSN